MKVVLPEEHESDVPYNSPDYGECETCDEPIVDDQIVMVNDLMFCEGCAKDEEDQTLPTIAMSLFARNRHTSESEFSHFEGPEGEIIKLVRDRWASREPGYGKESNRNRIVLVPVEPANFRTGVIQLEEGDIIAGVYEPRQAGEEPRKRTWVMGRGKVPARACDIVLYSHDTLAENDEQSCDAEWEIVSINARPTLEEMPIGVGTLLSNHFQVSGGTDTHMNDTELVAALKVSFLYWRDKAHAAPAPDREDK